MNFDNVNDILEFAMEQEQEAVDFYLNLAEKSKNKEMKAVFQEFAEEEVSHKARLSEIQNTQINDLETDNISDLKVADYVVKAKPHENMTYEEALMLAMNKEKAAFKLYSNLAARISHPELKKVFQALAIEESKHKLRFELEYDEFVLRDN